MPPITSGAYIGIDYQCEVNNKLNRRVLKDPGFSSKGLAAGINLPASKAIRIFKSAKLAITYCKLLHDLLYSGDLKISNKVKLK